MTSEQNGHRPQASVNASTNGASGAYMPRHTHVAIIGTGFSGLGMAIRLTQEDKRDFIIFEKNPEVGGTWWENHYPGIACDVPSNLYSFSFALNPNWSNSYSPGPEIQRYLRHCAEKFNLIPKIRFNTAVREAYWDDDAKVWNLDTEAGPVTADFLVGAMGPLAEAQIPNLPGMDDFKGPMFHSQKWDHDYDLKDKRVAVVGTGASAIQFVPQIQPEVKALHLFQRTAPWVMPRSERPISAIEHFLFKRLPFTQRIVRAAVYCFLEIRVLGFMKYPSLMKRVQKIAELQLARQVPEPELRRKVTPDFTIGCKRVLMANNYYPALRKPNVEVITEGVKEVRENSIVAADGTEREVDAIIWGTGFHVTDSPAWNHVHGRNGASLNEIWQGSPQAFLGTSVTGFPNLFLMAGPNTGLGHTSLMLMIEASIEHALGAMKFAETNDVAAIEVKPEAQKQFNDWVQDHVKDTIWNTGGCASWYIDANGLNTTIWPDYTFRFIQRSRVFDPANYVVRGRDGGEMRPVTPARATEPEPAAV